MRLRRLLLAGLTGTAVLAGMPTAQAQDTAPAQQREDFPRMPSTFMTPDHPDFWNLNVVGKRVFSPYGGENIYCRAFYGVAFDCLQNGKQLKELRPPFQLPHAVYFYMHEDYGLSSPSGQ